MTGAEALYRLEEIGARILLQPDGTLDVTAPRRPETEALIDELAAHKPEAVAVLQARPLTLTLPGRDERPCLACGRQCPEGVLFDTGACFETWKAHRRLRATRTTTGPARSIPPGGAV